MNRPLIALLILITCTATAVSVVRHRTPKPAAPVVGQQDQAPDVERVKELPPAVAATEGDGAGSPESRAPARVRGKRKIAAPVASGGNPPMDPTASAGTGAAEAGAGQNANAPEPLIAVPVARLALSAVGMDPDADLIWAMAINDPNMPPEARKDLIEDLNEDGFPDPKHVTPDDLPLILSRIDLIAQLAPDSMDDVNAAAFLEAYKDLTNMVNRLTRQ
jgi:hypothetical protein